MSRLKGEVVVLVTAMALLYTSPGRLLCAENTSEPVRPCSQSDLIGSWEMVGLKTSIAVDEDDPFFFKYQRFEFREDGHIRHMTSNKPFTDVAEGIMEAGPALVTFAIDEPGVLVIRNPSFPRPVYSLCGYILSKMIPSDQPGDILLTDYGKDGKLAFQRHLRKR